MSTVATENLVQTKPRTYKSVVSGIVGPRGSGKTLLLTYLSILDMKRGKTVYSNYPIEANVTTRKGIVKVQSQPLNYESLLAIDQSLLECVLVIDEFNLWFHSHRWMTYGNKIMSIFIQQIRKRHASLYYSSQSFKSCDGFVRDQTDMLVKCADMAKTPSGLEQGLTEGEFINLMVLDVSGYFTGRRYEDFGDVFFGMLHGKPLWNCYSTEYFIDPWQALSRVKMKTPEIIIDTRPREEGGLDLPPAQDIFWKGGELHD